MNITLGLGISPVAFKAAVEEGRKNLREAEARERRASKCAPQDPTTRCDLTTDFPWWAIRGDRSP